MLDRSAEPAPALPEEDLHSDAANPRRGPAGDPDGAAQPAREAEAVPWRCLPFLLRQRRAGYGNCDRQDRSSQTHHDVIAPPHSALSMNFALFALSLGTARPLRIRRDILLHIQSVKQVEIGIHIVILVQSLEITDSAARSGIHNLHRLRLKMSFLSKE